MSVYIYAITSEDHPHRLDGLTGVGDPASDLRSLPAGPLKAVVSDAPEGLRAKRRDLAAHESVQERLLEDGAVLPMRFGLLADSDEEVVDALKQNAATYEDALRTVHGCTEYHLKLARDEEDLLREIVAESGEVQRLNARTRAQPGDHSQKVALGELISQEIERRRDSTAREVVGAVSGTAVQHAVGQQTTDDFLALSFLVRREQAHDFSRAVQGLADRFGPGSQLTLHGPLPPYSFV